MRFLVYLLGIAGSVGSLVYSFSFSISNNLIFISCMIVGIGIYWGYYSVKSKRNFIIKGLLANVILLFLPTTLSCLSYLISVVIHKYREVSVYNFEFQSGFVFYDDPLSCTITFLMIFIPMFLLATAALDNKKYLLAIIALLPGVFIELLFTITPPWYFLGSYVLYVLILLIAALQKGTTLKKPMLLISVLAMIITYLAFPVETYRPSRYSLFDKSKAPISTAGNIKEEYDINKQGDRYYRDAIDFLISGENISLSNFKIRGIAYDQYLDGSWESKHYEREYDWFSENLETIVNITKAKHQTVEIEQLSGYSQRNYTPYFIINDDLRFYGDHYEGKNPQTYEMIIANDDFNAVLLETRPDAKKALLNEIAKRNGTEQYLRKSFNQNRYESDDLITVPEETGEIIDHFISENGIVDNGEVFDYISQCTKALTNKTTYTLTPGHEPKGDAVDYFLNVSKKGYCVHYASTLALMLRRAGYPARFAVGYQVPGSTNKAGDLIVKDSNGHAWVEILDEYLGWIPVEATPTGLENPNTPTDTVAPAPAVEVPEPKPDTPDNDDQVDDKDKSQVQEESFEIPVPVYYLTSLIIIMIVFIVQAKVRRDRMFDQALNNNQKVCYYYHYLNKLKLDCSAIKSLVDKARFSKHQINDDELKIVKDFYDQKTNEYYHQLNIFKKIWIKYILVRL